MDPDQTTISEILSYPIREDGTLVTRRGGISRMKPKLGAPPPSQPGSVDWTMNILFGSTHKAVEMIESLVAGQGENADEKWLRFVLLYKQWELQFKRGELPSPPTLNQVCHSLNFDSQQFISELQGGIQQMMKGVAALKASLAVPEVMDRVVDRATDLEADVKERELALRIAGVIDEKGGVSVQINNTNNQVMLKSDKEKLKAPLLQFSETTVDIDNEVRREPDVSKGE